MKYKIGDKVKIVKCIDDAIPIDEALIGKIGTVIKFSGFQPQMISVCIAGLKIDAYWPEELEMVKPMEVKDGHD